MTIIDFYVRFTNPILLKSNIVIKRLNPLYLGIRLLI